MVIVPVMVDAPGTLNAIAVFGVGLVNASRAVAVTQCSVPTGLVAAGGGRMSVAAAVATYTLVAAPAGAAAPAVPFALESAAAVDHVAAGAPMYSFVAMAVGSVGCAA